VHMDVGGVRAWPRMTRNELARLFPDGKTMHIPSDGRPLPGYEQAVADYKRRVGASAIEVAGGGAKGPGDTGKRRNLFAALFGGGGDEDEEPAAIAAGGAEEEAPAKVQTASAPAARDALPGVAGSTAAPAEQDINAPVPAVRPAFKETPADGGVAVALVAPEKNSAQEALAAAMQPTTAVPSEFADLSALKVPVPQMLDRRDMNALIANETLVASADGQAQEFGFVPVPGMRPAGEEALAAVAHAEVTIPASADRPALASAAQPPAAGTRVALAAPTSEDRTPAFSPAIEVAAYAPQPGSASREAIFDSVFDTEADAPSKGARPKRQDAEAKSRSSVRTEPKLTKKIISEWALSAGRVATLSKPVKAPRFVSKSLRVAPTTVYAAGFTSNSGAVDTARFSGSAVNFMEVKKFSTN
ncbi:ATP/GTP-binding protein, partial [Sinorhizobium meliloti]